MTQAEKEKKNIDDDKSEDESDFIEVPFASFSERDLRPWNGACAQAQEDTVLPHKCTTCSVRGATYDRFAFVNLKGEFV